MMERPATELRGRLLVAGRIVPGAVTFQDERITSVRTEAASDAAARLIVPGFVDLHVHGFGGADPLEDLGAMARQLARAGTTAFQPTLFPAAPDQLGPRCARLSVEVGAWNARNRGVGASVVGLHLEGPFVNPLKAGALPVSDLAEPSRQALSAIVGPASGGGRAIRTMTLAPELSGAEALIEELVRLGIRPSLGHSQATAEQARNAARSGACGATHLFNAMAPLHHREVGLAGCALTDATLFTELIGDLVHVGADAVRLALAARGPRGLCLVSDALRGAGTGCERFHSHGREHVLRGGAAWYPGAGPQDAPRLAGSALSQWEMVQGLVRGGVLSLEEALTMASETPARALGLDRSHGRIAPGARADLLVIDPQRLSLEEIWVGGTRLAANA